jgi:hypothetical protein
LVCQLCFSFFNMHSNMNSVDKYIVPRYLQESWFQDPMWVPKSTDVQVAD